MATKTKASIAASRAANNARITAANTRAGATVAQQQKADASALASMNAVRSGQGLAPQTAIGEQASGRTNGALSIDQTTNEVKDASGNVVAKGATLQDALAKQTQLSSGAAPTVAGRPDLFAVAPGANQEVKPFFDQSTKTMVTPKTATPQQLAAQQSGSLDSFNKAQGLTYLDAKTFKELQPNLNEADLIRGPNGQLWLRQGLTPEQVRARAATSVAGTSSGVTGDVPASDFTVDVPDVISTDTITEMMKEPVTETDFNTMLAEIQVKQAELLKLMVPGADEQATKAQINDIKAQVEKTLTELSMGLNNVEDQPIAMQFITGQQASIQRSAEAKLQNLARIETNLLNELGLEQEARQVQASVAQTQLGYLQTNLDTAFKVKQMLQQEEDSIFNRTRALKQDAQSALSTILETMKGIDETDMTSSQQKQLQDMAISAGIPYSLLTAGLSAVKKQMMAETALDYAKLDASTNGGNGKQLPAAQAVTLSEGFQIPLVLDEVAAMLDPNSPSNQRDLFDPIKGRIALLNPYDTAAQTAESNLRRASQIVGKYMEGGVLRAEDEKKYRAMLPQLTDTPEVAKNKLDSLQVLLGRKSQQYLDDFESAGFDVSGFKGRLPGAMIESTETSGGFIPINKSYSSINSLLQENPTAQSAISSLKQQGWTDDMILQATEQNGGLGFNTVGGDTNQAASSVTGLSVSQSGSPLEIAKSYLGLNAKDPKQAKTLSAFFKKAGGMNLDPSTTAWCAAFANSVLGAAGIKGTGSAMAQSFLKFGTPVNRPTKGDIVVFERGNAGSGLGHVGFIVGINSNGTLQVLGGNQSGKTSIETFKTNRVLGYRRISGLS